MRFPALLPIVNRGEIAAWVPGAPVPEAGVVNPRVVLAHVPAEVLKVPSPVELPDTTFAELTRYDIG